jgi:dTDP-4-dehydrorhamnose 3,5-epimerase
MSSQHSQILEAASLKDGQFVTPEGKPCRRMIEGVRIRDLVLHTDDRGTVCEMFDPRWGWHPDPLVFTYFYTIRPGLIKGWAMHKNHEDRYCIMQGEIRVVLYDSRADSPTFGLVVEHYLTEHHRQLLSIPSGVWHADQNVGG